MMTEKKGIWLCGIPVYIQTNLGLSWSESVEITVLQTPIRDQ